MRTKAVAPPPKAALKAIVPTVDLDTLAQFITDQLMRERDMFLAWVDERERVLGISPRTAEIRRWWREGGCPNQ